MSADSSSGPALFEVVEVAKTYPNGTRALRGVSLTVRRGDNIVLLGRNGSGKSTLLRCLNALERPDAGRVVFAGADLGRMRGGELRAVRRRVGVVFQKFNLVAGLSVFQNTLFGALGEKGGLWGALGPVAPAATRARALECLARVGLADLAARRADQLSGGQQQRVAIARMLMQDPEVVLADEPVASLDPQSGRQVMELLAEIVRERGLTLICTLHHLDLALEYGDRVIGLRAGEKVIDGRLAGKTEADLAGLYEEREAEAGAGTTHENKPNFYV
jgi:phosphonate transport system ATP-binding protein